MSEGTEELRAALQYMEEARIALEKARVVLADGRWPMHAGSALSVVHGTMGGIEDTLSEKQKTIRYWITVMEKQA